MVHLKPKVLKMIETLNPKFKAPASWRAWRGHRFQIQNRGHVNFNGGGTLSWPRFFESFERWMDTHGKASAYIPSHLYVSKSMDPPPTARQLPLPCVFFPLCPGWPGQGCHVWPSGVQWLSHPPLPQASGVIRSCPEMPRRHRKPTRRRTSDTLSWALGQGGPWWVGGNR